LVNDSDFKIESVMVVSQASGTFLDAWNEETSFIALRAFIPPVSTVKEVENDREKCRATKQWVYGYLFHRKHFIRQEICIFKKVTLIQRNWRSSSFLWPVDGFVVR
jgi:hypothetical protein